MGGFVTKTGTRTTSGLFAGNPTIFCGWNAVETGGAAAELTLRHGSATGQIIEHIKLSAGQAVGESYGEWPEVIPAGLYLVVVSGAVEVNARLT